MSDLPGAQDLTEVVRKSWMMRVYVASPLRGGPRTELPRTRIGQNRAYLNAALADCFRRDEAPWAPHACYPLVLDDNDEEQRYKGMEAGKAWLCLADLIAVYTDRGISEGMHAEIAVAQAYGVRVEYRQLGGMWAPAEAAA